MKAPTVSDLIVDTLRNAGAERVHGLPGDSLNGIEEALRSCGGIEWVHVRHEKSAAFAARTASSSSAGAALVEVG